MKGSYELLTVKKYLFVQWNRLQILMLYALLFSRRNFADDGRESNGRQTRRQALRRSSNTPLPLISNRES